MSGPGPRAERNGHNPRSGACDAAHAAIPNPTVWKFTEYDHFADRGLCDDVSRRG